jgi:phospholipid/cholesterol/gamma-HCH transport system substrate-binding protein
MPSKQKVSIAQLKVGILGIVALSCIALIVFLLTGNMNWFEKRVPLYTYTSDAAGLTEGSPVRLNGIDAGQVTRVALSGSANPTRVIRVDFQVNSNMLKNIPVDSMASIDSDNLLGSTKYLQINKGASPQTVQAGATLRASDTRQFDQLVQQGYGLLDSLQAILGKASDIIADVENGKGTIGKLLVDQSLYTSLQATVTQVQLLATTLNSRTGTIGHLINDDTLYKQAETLLGKIDQITQGIQQGQGTAGLLLKDPKMYNDLDHAIGQLNTILTNLNAGKGTAGQMLTSNKLGNQISNTLGKVDTTLDKVNSGQGTIGQLLTNPALYDSATGSTRELHELLKDFRANPKKFLTIRLRVF